MKTSSNLPLYSEVEGVTSAVCFIYQKNALTVSASAFIYQGAVAGPAISTGPVSAASMVSRFSSAEGSGITSSSDKVRVSFGFVSFT